MIRISHLVAASVIALAASTAAQAKNDIDTAREAVYPALVNIAVVGTQYQNGRLRRFPAAGSGVIVSPEGHVLTNFHVAGETTRITCTLPDGRTFEATPIVLDPLTDLAVLQLETEGDDTALPYAMLGDSERLEVGDDVLAMGNPLTLSSSMTRGIVSNPHRVFTSFTGAEMEETDLGGGQRTGIFTRWIQHDALILGGNSGGPLVNMKGEVVGINDRGGSGMSFAIPSNIAADVLAEALEHGEIRRGWFGLSFKPVDKMDDQEGALVTWVVEGGPADDAGLQPGDLLTSVDGEAIHVSTFEGIPPLLKRMADVKPGQVARLEWTRPIPGAEPDELGVTRDRTPMTAEVMAAPLEQYLGEQSVIDPWGITVRDVTIQMALSRKYPNADGVMVTGVRPGRPGEKAQPSLRRGDVITAIDGTPVKTLEDFESTMKTITPGTSSLVTMRRGDAEVLTVVETVPERESVRGSSELAKAWLGIETQVLTRPVAESLGLGRTNGFRITRVYPGSEAAAAGLTGGDIITAVNGSPLRASRPQDSGRLTRRIETMPVGETAELTLHRDGKPEMVAVTLEATPAGANSAENYEAETLEFTVRDLVYMDTIENRWGSDLQGVIVTAVENGGWASLAGLASGDLVVSLNDIPVSDTASFEDAISTIEAQRPDVVKAFVYRGYRTTFVFMEPDWPEDDELVDADSD
ncbi:MAG: PDZ domain-containing protein [Phycisphaerales bacterium]|nr:PDZ domain-containing protein [Phycisphaerales bacterium]